MEAEFWLSRWQEGRTGFHQDGVSPLLQKHWTTLGLPADSRVLVPLCGKSQDMAWLAAEGHHVVGVELSQMAVDQFFAEHGKIPVIHHSPAGKHHVAGNIDIVCGDIFALDAHALQEFTGVYDRAALIALPPGMRKRYTDHIYGQLALDYRGLLITLDYPQDQKDGPPFSVPNAEVQRLFTSHSNAAVLEKRDILADEQKFRQAGVNRLDTLVYQLTGLNPAKR